MGAHTLNIYCAVHGFGRRHQQEVCEPAGCTARSAPADPAWTPVPLADQGNPRLDRCGRRACQPVPTLPSSPIGRSTKEISVLVYMPAAAAPFTPDSHVSLVDCKSHRYRRGCHFTMHTSRATVSRGISVPIAIRSSPSSDGGPICGSWVSRKLKPCPLCRSRTPSSSD